MPNEFVINNGFISKGNSIVQGGLTATTFNLSGSQIETLWTSYTPTWTASVSNPSIGNGTLEGYYKLIGKTCFVRGNIVIGSTTTLGSGEWYAGLPFSAKHADAIQMCATILDSGTAWYNAQLNGARAGFTGKSAIQYVNTSTGNTNSLSPTEPIVWVAGDRFIWNGSYEIA